MDALFQLMQSYNPSLQGTFTQHLLVLFLIMARIFPLMFLTPVLGSKHTSQEVKIGLALMMTAIVYLPVYTTLNGSVPAELGPFVGLMLKEFAIGLLVGYLTSLIFYAVLMAGRIMDTTATRSMSDVQAPHMQANATPLGDIAYMYLLIMFFATGGHMVLLEGVLRSFSTFSILDFGLTPAVLDGLAELIMKGAAEILVIAMLIAGPVLVATFLADVTFGLLNRVAPQLNAYFMSMPVKALGSIVLLFFAWDVVAAAMAGYIEWSLLRMQDVFDLFAKVG